jgi:putative protease
LQLEQVYSRGSGPYFLNGTDHQAVVKGRAPRHRGVWMGRVAGVAAEGVMVEPSPANSLAPLKPGDGVVFDAADWRSPQEPEEGGRVYQADARDGMLELRFGNGVVNPRRIRAGDLVWRTHDPNVDKAARPYLEPSAPVRKQAVRVRVTAREGAALDTEWILGDLRVTARSDGPLGTARDRPLTEEYLAAQLGRLGNTPYELAGVKLDVRGAPFAAAGGGGVGAIAGGAASGAGLPACFPAFLQACRRRQADPRRQWVPRPAPPAPAGSHVGTA